VRKSSKINLYRQINSQLQEEIAEFDKTKQYSVCRKPILVYFTIQELVRGCGALFAQAISPILVVHCGAKE